MRIIGGAWRGRTLRPLIGGDTRPTADRARQTLFDMLGHAPWAPPDGLRGLRVLDAFAGTGAFGLEALSRGAAHATFVDNSPVALAVLRGNVALLGAAAQSTILAVDIRQVSRVAQPASLIFLDAPYRQGLTVPALMRLAATHWLGPDTLIVIETAADEEAPDAGELLAGRHVGAARLHVFRSSGHHPLIMAQDRR